MSADRLTAWVAIALAWCAGFVDVGAFQRLSSTFTSHITGNTSHLGIGVVAGEWQAAGRAGWAVLCFVIGLMVSAALQHIERREGIRSAFSIVLGVEIVLLGVFIWFASSPSTPLLLLIFLPAAAMGMQTVTVTRSGSLRLYTTFHTANLSTCSETLTGYLFWAWDRLRGHFWHRCMWVLLLTPRQEDAQRAAVSLGLWMAFLAGAICGFASEKSWGPISILIPMALLAAIIPVDLRCPKELESE
jgi:uncharacterized membrane protein YoaK (UPF0700 family)